MGLMLCCFVDSSHVGGAIEAVRCWGRAEGGINRCVGFTQTSMHIAGGVSI